jgi:hypothetical protein
MHSWTRRDPHCVVFVQAGSTRARCALPAGQSREWCGSAQCWQPCRCSSLRQQGSKANAAAVVSMPASSCCALPGWNILPSSCYQQHDLQPGSAHCLIRAHDATSLLCLQKLASLAIVAATFWCCGAHQLTLPLALQALLHTRQRTGTSSASQVAPAAGACLAASTGWGATQMAGLIWMQLLGLHCWTLVTCCMHPTCWRCLHRWAEGTGRHTAQQLVTAREGSSPSTVELHATLPASMRVLPLASVPVLYLTLKHNGVCL